MKSSTGIFVFAFLFIIAAEMFNGTILKSPWIYIDLSAILFLPAGIFIGIAVMERLRGR